MSYEDGYSKPTYEQMQERIAVLSEKLALQAIKARSALRSIAEICNEAIGEDAHRDDHDEVLMEIWEIAEVGERTPGEVGDGKRYAGNLAVIREVLERAAQECEKVGEEWEDGSQAETCATRIRGLRRELGKLAREYGG